MKSIRTSVLYDLLGGPDETIGGVSSTYAPASVPEPAALALLGVAFAGMGLAKRRRLN